MVSLRVPDFAKNHPGKTVLGLGLLLGVGTGVYLQQVHHILKPLPQVINVVEGSIPAVSYTVTAYEDCRQWFGGKELCKNYYQLSSQDGKVYHDLDDLIETVKERNGVLLGESVEDAIRGLNSH